MKPDIAHTSQLSGLHRPSLEHTRPQCIESYDPFDPESTFLEKGSNSRQYIRYGKYGHSVPAQRCRVERAEVRTCVTPAIVNPFWRGIYVETCLDLDSDPRLYN